jgi:uncharacterized RDD family membrane protein YckC
MDCPICGIPYPCAHSAGNTSALRDHVVREDRSGARPSQGVAINPSSASELQRRADEELWRREVASRVQQHRARRRRRFDPNASFEFDFPADAALAIAPTLSLPQQPLVSFEEQGEAATSLASGAPEMALPPLAPRKIIRFPRFTDSGSGDFVDALELAEPWQPAPRILEAPEPRQLELLPTFPDIRLDDEPEENSLRAMDLPPQPAPLPQRILSGIIDSAVLLVSAAVMVGVFTQLTATLPPSRLAVPYVLISCVSFWCLFQYVFLVFGRGTPGMRAAGLELIGFDGEVSAIRARRNRAFAATLSALSVGLGFLWALVDEDTLGWHDRMSETYLKSRQHSEIGTQPLQHETKR